MKPKQNKMLTLQISPTSRKPLIKNEFVQKDLQYARTERGTKSNLPQEQREGVKDNSIYQANKQRYNDIKSRVAQNQMIIQKSKESVQSKQQSQRSSFALKSFQNEDDQSYNQQLQSFRTQNSIHQSQASQMIDARYQKPYKDYQQTKVSDQLKKQKRQFSIPEPEKYPEKYYTPNQRIQDNYRLNFTERIPNQQRVVQESHKNDFSYKKFMQNQSNQVTQDQEEESNLYNENQEDLINEDYEDENEIFNQRQILQLEHQQQVMQNINFQQQRQKWIQQDNELYEIKEVENQFKTSREHKNLFDQTESQEYFNRSAKSTTSSRIRSPIQKNFNTSSNENLSGLFQEQILQSQEYQENEQFQLVLKMLYQNNQQYLESLEKLKKQKQSIKQLKLYQQQAQNKNTKLQDQIRNLTLGQKLVKNIDRCSQTENDSLLNQSRNNLKQPQNSKQQQKQPDKLKQSIVNIQETYLQNEQLDIKSNTSLIAKIVVQKYVKAAQFNMLTQSYSQIEEKCNNLKQQIKNLKIYQKSNKNKSKSKSRDIARKSINEVSTESKKSSDETLLKAQKIVKLIDNNIKKQEKETKNNMHRPLRSKSSNSRPLSALNNQFLDQSSVHIFGNECSFGSEAEVLGPLRNQIAQGFAEQEIQFKKENQILQQTIQDQNADLKAHQEKIKQLMEEIQLLQEENQQFQSQLTPLKSNRQHFEISFSNDISCEFQEQEDKIKKQQNQIVDFISKNSQLKNEIASLKVTQSNKLRKLQDRIQQLEQENQILKNKSR